MSKQELLSNKEQNLKLLEMAKKNRELSAKFLQETGRDPNAFMHARWNGESDSTSTEHRDLVKEFEQWKIDNNVN